MICSLKRCMSILGFIFNKAHSGQFERTIVYVDYGHVRPHNLNNYWALRKCLTKTHGGKRKSMRIVFVVPKFLAKNKPSTGLPNYIYRVSKALMELGHMPIVITAGEINENVKYNGIRVIRRSISTGYLQQHELLGYATDTIKINYVLTKELKKLCKSERIDIIQFCSLRGLGSFYRGKVPSIMRLSSYAPEYYKYSETFSKKYIRLVGFFERLSARNRDAIISPSNVMANAFMKDTHKKVDTIETPFIDDTPQKDIGFYQNALAGKRYFLFFGSLYAEKGIFVIAKIIERLLMDNPEFHFVFIGSVYSNGSKNPLKELYHKAGKCRDRVLYFKPLKHAALYPVVEHADYVVLPSLMDNFPNACIEAMYFGRIVIGTDGTSFEQLITDGVSGFLAKPGDAKSLYLKIQQAMQLSLEERKRISESAIHRISLLTPEIVVKQLIDYYRRVIEQKKRK